MWLIANVVELGDEVLTGHCYKNRVYRDLDKAYEELKKVRRNGGNYKLFKVFLQEVEGNG